METDNYQSGMDFAERLRERLVDELGNEPDIPWTTQYDFGLSMVNVRGPLQYSVPGEFVQNIGEETAIQLCIDSMRIPFDKWRLERMAGGAGVP